MAGQNHEFEWQKSAQAAKTFRDSSAMSHRMDLLGHFRKKGRNQKRACRASAYAAQRMQAPAVLLARVSASVKDICTAVNRGTTTQPGKKGALD